MTRVNSGLALVERREKNMRQIWKDRQPELTRAWHFWQGRKNNAGSQRVKELLMFKNHREYLIPDIRKMPFFF